MARRDKLVELEKEHGNLHKVIPELVNSGGQKHAAEVLRTSQATISKWLTDNHYEKFTIYQKKEIPAPQQN